MPPSMLLLLLPFLLHCSCTSLAFSFITPALYWLSPSLLLLLIKILLYCSFFFLYCFYSYCPFSFLAPVHYLLSPPIPHCSLLYSQFSFIAPRVLTEDLKQFLSQSKSLMFPAPKALFLALKATN